jgi:integrase
MNEQGLSETNEVKKKRAAPRYWTEIKGKLYARLQYKGDDGKYKVKYKPITDKRTAKRAVDEMRQELELHGEETLHSDKMTFSELVEKYRVVKVVPATYQNGVKISGKRSLVYFGYILPTLTDYFGHKAIRSIKSGDLESFKQKRLDSITMHGKTRNIASVNRELSIMRTILNYAVQNDWLLKNPFVSCQGIIAISAEVERDRTLSFEEESRLLAVCAGPRQHLRSLLICALDTAMRRGEMFKMTWRDVNFITNEIYIPQTNTKTEEARTVGITPRLRIELENLWETSPKDLTASVFGVGESIKTAWKTACKLANITDFRFHDCRHTATTRMISSGSPHTEVMKITGHSQIKTFLRYLNITTETANKVANRLGDYLSDRQIKIFVSSDAVN